LHDDRVLVLDLVYFEFSVFEFERLDDRLLVRFEFVILDFRFYFMFFAGHFCPGEPSLLMGNKKEKSPLRTPGAPLGLPSFATEPMSQSLAGANLLPYNVCSSRRIRQLFPPAGTAIFFFRERFQ
jgi:hypothetical protein